MASVHLARMDGPGGFQKWVAIKRIHPHLVEDDQFVDMFLDEARIAAGINHANVAQVFDLGKDDNTYWIAMEYLHGEPLREIMRRAEERHSLISAELAARICSDAAEGLHAAHELRGKNGQLLGLVHRDVTPHNLFLTYDGYTKVVDFGIAKVADRLSSTRAGTLKGKLAYMSPEQVRGAEVDRTTDIFALGVVLWELTTGHRLFRMDTDLDTLEKVQACVVPPPSTIVQNYPVELESVVMKALAKRKQDRFQTARELSRALQNFLMRRGAFVGPEEVAHFVRQVFSDRIQKREAHLAWAAEVTSTINVDQLRAGQAVLPGSAEEISLNSYSDRDPLAVTDERRGARAPTPPPSLPHPAPASGPYPANAGARNGPAYAPTPPPALAAPPPQAAPAAAQMAATSLMDDDEDVPTAVATRPHLERVGMRPAPQPEPPRQGPRPAAGMPAPAFSPEPPRTQAFPQMPNFPPNDEHTAALPSGAFPGGDDLGATIALPGGMTSPAAAAQAFPGQPQGYGGFGNPQQQPPQGYGQQPQLGNGYGAQQQPFGGGAPGQPNTSSFPAISMQQAQAAQQHQMHQPQSQVETALSLPRPDPAALWLAQQEAAQGQQRKNTGVLVAVGVLTALCVTGIGALLYFKLRTPPAPAPIAVGTETQTAVPTPAPPPTETAAAAPSDSAPAPEPSATAAATGAPSATPTAPKPTPTSTGGTAPTPVPSSTASTATAGKEEPGFLTIVCTPYCDDVVDQGRSLGPSPVVRVAVKPGQHRITLKRSGQPNKVISVIVVSGQVTAQRVSMK